MKRRGFTLIELSVVVVIVGLLIGGILVAKSMINTAKVVTSVKQIQQFDIAVSQFKKKMGTMPGDSGMMGCQNGNFSVCDNGIIEDHWLDFPNTLSFDNEVANFWPDLNKSGFMPQTSFSPVVNGNFNVSVTDPANPPNFPAMAVGKNSGVIAWTQTTPSFAGPFYLIGDFSSTSTTQINLVAGSIPVVDALAIDSKIDDGLPDYNGPLGGGNDYSGGYRVYDTLINGYCLALVGGQYQYNVSIPDAKCALLIRMNAQ